MSSSYIRHELKNIQPLRITNDSSSQSGQSTTLKYIPGTAIRGFVINALKDASDFENIKPTLFSNKVRFLNAYIREEDHDLLPSPKGFYEDKRKTVGKKAIENVLINGDFTSGYKRAGLGDFCFWEKDCVHYYGVRTGSDLKIKVNTEKDESRNMFRLDHIKPGYHFTGYIAVDDEQLLDRIKNLFQGEIYIGNAKAQGLGLCRVAAGPMVTDEVPYSEYLLDEDTNDHCYMMLLSDTVMVGPDGEPVGINEEELARLLGVSKVNIKFCSTSSVTICSYNRKIGAKGPSVNAYEKGSVFKVEFEGERLTADRIKTIVNDGLGTQRNIGMGRVMILKEYDSIRNKLAHDHVEKDTFSGQKHLTDDTVLKLAARNYYRMNVRHAMAKAALPDDEFSSLKLNASQFGRVEAIILQNKYDMVGARSTLDKFFEHEKQKEDEHKKHDNKKSLSGLKDFVYFVLDTPIADLFELPELKESSVFTVPTSSLLSDEEITRLKMDFILMRIRMNNRKGVM